VIRARSAWLVALPLVLAGWLAAHSLAYRLAGADGHGHGGLHAPPAHGYLAHAPALLAALAVGAVGVLLLRVAAAARRRRSSGVNPAGLVCLPVAGFAVQEHVERLVHTGALPLATVAEPTFVIGLALQLPFALAALFVARVAVRAADGLGANIALARHRARADAPAAFAWPRRDRDPRYPRLARWSTGRAPPLPS
jgi:hypothetical protein